MQEFKEIALLLPKKKYYEGTIVPFLPVLNIMPSDKG